MRNDQQLTGRENGSINTTTMAFTSTNKPGDGTVHID